MKCLRLSFLLFTLALPCLGGDEATVCCAPAAQSHLLRDGRCLSYREYGSRTGNPVLYFHGMVSSSLEAILINKEVRRCGIRLIAIDRPGIGESSYDPDRTTLDWVNDVEQLTQALGFGNRRFGIIGVSGGASYACACALKIPHRISHLAIVSGHSPMDAEGVTPGDMDKSIRLISNHPILGKGVLASRSRQLKRNPEKVVKALTQNWNEADRILMKDPTLRQCMIENLQSAFRQRGKGIYTDVDLLNRYWGFDVCEIKGVSVSIWNGGNDPVVTTSMAFYFHDQIAGSTLTIGPKEGHATMLKNYAPAILKKF